MLTALPDAANDLTLPCHEQRAGAATEFGGNGNFFRGPRFLNDVFSGKICPFSRPKFLMTFFYSSTWFSRCCVIYCNKMSYATLFYKKTHYFRKEFLYNT